MSVRDWYYCRECEVYGHGPACWCCDSTTPQRAELPRLDDKQLVSERMMAALDRARELSAAHAAPDVSSGAASGTSGAASGARPETGHEIRPLVRPVIPVRYAS